MKSLFCTQWHYSLNRLGQINQFSNIIAHLGYYITFKQDNNSAKDGEKKFWVIFVTLICIIYIKKINQFPRSFGSTDQLISQRVGLLFTKRI